MINDNQAVLKQFADLAQAPDEEIDVARAAFLIAATEFPDLDVDGQVRLLDSLAAGASRRLGDGQDNLFCLNTLAEYLFDEVGFSGNQEDYYDPDNSYLNQVLSRRLGIPITLSLICSEVGKRIGIPLVGIGMPGHFLLRHQNEGDLFLDPFHRGILLSVNECAQRLNEVARGEIAWDPVFLTPVGNRDFVARILRNLKGIYLNGADHVRAIRIMDLLVAFLPAEARERRDRGLLHFELEHWEEAKEDLRHYLDSGSPNQDTAGVNWMLGRIDANQPH
ncbi:MAG: transglutaminase family protein [Chloroflexi bacterium]|nr:transglutaminase family protein [Chloroflexota bacterium]